MGTGRSVIQITKSRRESIWLGSYRLDKWLFWVQNPRQMRLLAANEQVRRN